MFARLGLRGVGDVACSTAGVLGGTRSAVFIGMPVLIGGTWGCNARFVGCEKSDSWDTWEV